jgi:hypothetical protein
MGHLTQLSHFEGLAVKGSTMQCSALYTPRAHAGEESRETLFCVVLLIDDAVCI